ncbi:unnamed protein product [Caretta caretta]
MAEAWRLEDEEGELRELGRRRRRGHLTSAADRSERNKPDYRSSGQGPLSSIRAAIKRRIRSGRACMACYWFHVTQYNLLQGEYLLLYFRCIGICANVPGIMIILFKLACWNVRTMCPGMLNDLEEVSDPRRSAIIDEELEKVDTLSLKLD